MRVTTGFALILGCLPPGGGRLPAQGPKVKDILIKKNGQKVRNVEVIQETLQEIRYKRRGKEATLPAAELAEIRWDPVPESFVRAGLAFDRGDYHLAANLFAEAASSAGRPALEAYASYRAAEALARNAALHPNQAETALGELSKWIEAHPTHRLTPAARYSLGRTQLLAGKPEDAARTFAALAKLAQDESLPPVWIARAKLGEGQAWSRLKDFSKARGAFLAASSTLGTVGEKSPEIVELLVSAKVGEGESYIAQGRFDEAKSFFSRMRAGSSDPATVAAAMCGEGQALYELGARKKDPKILREAQLLLARVSATDLFEGETTAKSRYLLAKTILLLGKAHEGPDYASRAEQLLDSVAKNFPDSTWGLLAEAERRKKG